jgi:hypothetical protein
MCRELLKTPMGVLEMHCDMLDRLVCYANLIVFLEISQVLR